MMKRYEIVWKQKGTHEKHLSVLGYKNQEREKGINALENKLAEKTDEYKPLSDRVRIYDKAVKTLKEMVTALNTSPEYQLPEP